MRERERESFIRNYGPWRSRTTWRVVCRHATVCMCAHVLVRQIFYVRWCVRRSQLRVSLRCCLIEPLLERFPFLPPPGKRSRSRQVRSSILVPAFGLQVWRHWFCAKTFKGPVPESPTRSRKEVRVEHSGIFGSRFVTCGNWGALERSRTISMKWYKYPVVMTILLLFLYRNKI